MAICFLKSVTYVEMDLDFDLVFTDMQCTQGDQMRAEMPMSGIFEGLLAEKKDVGQWAESRAFSRKC